MQRFMLLIAALIVSAAASVSAFHAPRVNGFIPNQGQWPDEVLFLHRTANMHTWITRTGMVVDQYRIDGEQRTGHVIRLTWDHVGTLSPLTVREERPTGATVSFFQGRDPSRHHAGLAVLNTLRFDDLYPGIDLVYYLDDSGRLRYDFDVAPGANAGAMGFTVRGDEGMEIRSDAVILKTSMGGVNMTDLYAYVLGQRSLETQAVFTATSTGVAFRVPQWSGDVPLRVDPVVYGTYVGGENDDQVTTVRYRNNEVIIAGWTTGIEFPDDLGPYQEAVSGNLDAFVAKLSADLSTVLAYTYFGGTSDEVTTSMDVSDMGKVVITGTTESADIPVGVGAVGQLYKAERDGFVAKFDNGLLVLEAATYIGGNKHDVPHAVAFGIDESVYLVGGTNSDASFPVTLAHQFQIGGQWDAFAARFSANLGSFVFCTYYGGTGNEEMKALYVDDGGDFLTTGSTSSSDFETSPSSRWRWFRNSGLKPYDNTFNGGDNDAFLIRMYGDGTISKRRDENTFSTFFGGSGDEEGIGVFLDNVGRPIVVGWTTSTELEAVGTQQVAKSGGKDLFMAVLTDDGRGLTACTYYGGIGDDIPLGMIPSADKNVGIVYGRTTSVDFPIEGIGAVPDRQGPDDAFLVALSPFTTRYATTLPGSGTDAVVSVALDQKDDFYYVLESTSQNLYTHDGAWQSEPSGARDSYVGKFAYGVLALASPSRGAVWCIGTPANISWSGLDMNPGEKYTVEVSADNGESWSELTEPTDRQNLSFTVPETLEPGSTYRVRIRTERGHISVSDQFFVSAPPELQSISESRSACEGERIVLRAQATGTNLSYAWTHNGKALSGITADSMVIETLSSETAGTYGLTINGSCKPALQTEPILVSVAPQTSIVQQPEDVSVKVGESISLSVIAQGDDLSYQWSRNGDPIDGATTANFIVQAASVADAGAYTCRVSGTCGEATSKSAAVEVDNSVSVDEDGQTPLGLTLLGPIPASSSVRVRLTTPTSAMVAFRMIDVQGAVAATVSPRPVDPGATSLEIPVESLPSGTYGLEAVVGDHVLRTMLVIAR